VEMGHTYYTGTLYCHDVHLTTHQGGLNVQDARCSVLQSRVRVRSRWCGKRLAEMEGEGPNSGKSNTVR
jgi:hypothetical protein